MAEVLVLVEQTGATVKKSTLELLTAARRLGEPVAIWVGPGIDDAAIATLGEYGATSVGVAGGAQYVDTPVAPKAEVLAYAVEQHSPAAVLIAATAEGKEIAGRLAVKLGSGIVSDAIDLDADGTGTQSVFGGSTVVKSKVVAGTPVITVRPNAIAPEAAAATCKRVDIEPALSAAATMAKVTDRVASQGSSRPDLSEAAIVVSGGRGVGSTEGFAAVEALADALGGAVGASRAATDAGWYPHQFQVGQTGKTVSPQLYIAAGISGAIQHRAGMQTSKTIVAINKDPEAPILELADFTVIGDLHTVLPQLTDEVKKRKG